MLSAPARSFVPAGDGFSLRPSCRDVPSPVFRLHKPRLASPCYPLVCLCTSQPPSSSSSPSFPPQFATTTAPVTASGATVVTTTTTTSSPPGSASPVLKKRKRYRKAYPGENKGITEEMRFVAMRLRNDGPEGGDAEPERSAEGTPETWKPSTEGFLKYLVDSKLVFETLESAVDQSEDVAYAYFRKTGLERSHCIAKDLDWFREQGLIIPNPSSPGTTYSAYLNELAESSQPAFLCHFYNVYFAHATGGLEIGKQVSEKLHLRRELELYNWEEDVFELLQGTREKLDNLGEHWSRDEKNKCLREAAKCFRHLGQIIRLIIL